MEPELLTYHVDIDTTGPALQRFALALLRTGGALLPSRLIMGELGRGTSALLVVQLREETAEAFREICKPIAMRRPPKICMVACIGSRTHRSEVKP